VVEKMIENNTILTNNKSQVYTRDEMVSMLNLATIRTLYKASKLYRDTGGKFGIPNIQLAGPCSKVIYPKSMVNSWLENGNKILSF
jgi:hypothetical protein